MQNASEPAHAPATESVWGPQGGTTEPRVTVRRPQDTSTARTGWAAPLPAEQVAATLERMAG